MAWRDWLLGVLSRLASDGYRLDGEHPEDGLYAAWMVGYSVAEAAKAAECGGDAVIPGACRVM